MGHIVVNTEIGEDSNTSKRSSNGPLSTLLHYGVLFAFVFGSIWLPKVLPESVTTHPIAVMMGKILDFTGLIAGFVFIGFLIYVVAKAAIKLYRFRVYGEPFPNETKVSGFFALLALSAILPMILIIWLVSLAS